MYVPGIYIAWTRSKEVCTWKNIEKLACNPFMIGWDSAYVQESADQCIEGLDAYIPPKNGSIHVVSFPVAFLWKHV